MISYLQGVLVERELPWVVVKVNGVGYEVQIPVSSSVQLPELGSEISLYTHLVVREDGQFLYGFLNREQRALFRILIKVNGVGPKVALAILSVFAPDTFMQCVANDDAAALHHIPGVGAKTARRLLIEMRDKVATWQEVTTTRDSKSAVGVDDAVSALVALGYKQNSARSVVLKHSNRGLSSAELIRVALKEL